MKKILLFFILATLVSCSFNQTFSNRESDKDEAQKVAEKFYWELQYGSNQDKMYELFSDKFFEITSKEKLNQLNLDTQNHRGIIKQNDLVKWETLVVKGSDAKSQYLLIYNVARESGMTEETFSMLKENGIIKIVGYHINHIAQDEIE
ncbi:hypothetical protein CHRY9390_02163 [Chryseobacterium aquaeductus]|uniref:Lipoprotein n=1 Tax=Chryseobacterium aquaeductus TaxID=2675056 RepID=A0A9N8MIM1_9FLAO|nr:hypothetical protein [Chryseobacterium aquaeductus]CAA7331461.1 hypothetical protein CHRY9390_02163 [Chryseobacterium potabilaquae]CAD7810345.1 hypothetical protein CHRY9390_02163 [Chryseobacterium aquaeductus]